MKTKVLYRFLTLALLLVFVPAASAEMQSDNYRITSSVTSAGGGPTASDNFKNDSTLGQSSPLMDTDDPPYSENYENYPGFWYTTETEQEAICQCDLMPDDTIIPRGETLGFTATVTNNTDSNQTVQFATRVKLPNGKMYPPGSYLFGPRNVPLSPYGSRSGHLSHKIPNTAPLGIYTYYGYVGKAGQGIIHQCEFDFEVIPSGEAEGEEAWETFVDQEFIE